MSSSARSANACLAAISELPRRQPVLTSWASVNKIDENTDKTPMSGAENSAGQIRILLADDDEDDRMMARDALETSLLTNPLDEVVDGIELLEHLDRLLETGDPLPGLILLDLNMPRMDGREALAEIKGNPALRHIPVVVLTTSKAEEDVYRTYDLGVNSFISKPISFEGLVEVISQLGRYWLEMVELPKAA